MGFLHRKGYTIKERRSFLMGLLATMGIATLINITVIQYFPLYIPLSSFSAVRLSIIGLVTQNYLLVFASIVICVVLLVAFRSIRHSRIFVPSLVLIYLICDNIVLLFYWIDGISTKYILTWFYSIQLLTSLTTVIMLFVYVIRYWQIKHMR